MPVCVAHTVQKGTVRDATVCHDGYLVSVACHRAPLATQPLSTRTWKGPRAARWWMRWSMGTEWSLAAASASPRSLSCRVRKLVAPRALPGRVARRGKLLEMPWWAFPASSSCWGLVSLAWILCSYVLVGLPGKLLLPGPCLLGLDTLFLNGSTGTAEDLGDHRGKPCRGWLQLPVHKFGILGYPYSSTPTGAPGPGPHTVPCAVGPGPKQGAGTRGLVVPFATPHPPRPPRMARVD